MASADLAAVQKILIKQARQMSFHCRIRLIIRSGFFVDNIDLRRHLQDVEIVLIEAALEIRWHAPAAADSLKWRTTLIEKKFMIEKPVN